MAASALSVVHDARRVWLLYDGDEFIELQWRVERALERAEALGAKHITTGLYDGNLAGQIEHERPVDRN